jgi:ribonuclease HIII
MNDETRDLDRLVRDWWLDSPTEELFGRILSLAVSATVASLVPFARALQILETRQLRPAMSQRVEELRLRLENLRKREQQVDNLGDVNNDPQILFEVLNKDVDQIQSFDPDSLRTARLTHQESRGNAALALLETLGPGQLPRDVEDALREAVNDIIEREQQQAWGLFVAQDSSQGLALGIKFVLRDAGAELLADANPEMTQQARIASEFALKNKGKGWNANLEWPARFVGESIGLPLYVAALTALSEIPNHALTASTGKIEIDGKVTGVAGIKAKVNAAKRIGIRRLLVPRDNLAEAKSAAGDDLIVLPVANVGEVRGILLQPMSLIDLGYSGLIRLVRASVRDYQLIVQDESDENQGFKFVVVNTTGTAHIWVYRNGRVRAEGANGPALEAAKQLVANRVPPEPTQRGTLSFQLPGRELQNRFHAALLDKGAIDDSALQYQSWRMRLPRGRSSATIVLYTSGKCVIQGTAPAWDEAQSTADSITTNIGGLPKQPTPPKVSVESSTKDDSEPHIGTDEAGKGDYFGPLVSAAVFVNPESAPKLRQMGVRDSKTIADPTIRELAEKIRRMPGVRCAVTPINPRKYNELYETFRKEGKNLNSLLAWGHGRSIETLLNVLGNESSGPKFVIVDQFADKHYIEQRTRKAGIPVYQHPKAEADIAVAAASILARDGFLKWLERMSQRTQIVLPKGASPAVITAAKQFVRKWGAKWLGEVAKLHFRTTSQVLEGEEQNVDQHTPRWAADESGIQSES